LDVQNNPPDRASARRRCIAFFDQPSAEAFCAKETIMFQELRYRFARWRAYRETLMQLRQVPDSTLADAGILPDQIRQCARRASRGL
jgi:uncharacterized protein YjiS (DUF1127 family)